MHWEGAASLMRPMTDQFTALSPTALRDIIANIDRSLEIYAQYADRLHATELQAKSMLLALRARIVAQLENHPETEN